jgi:hypothetical protein
MVFLEHQTLVFLGHIRGALAVVAAVMTMKVAHRMYRQVIRAQHQCLAQRLETTDVEAAMV